VTFIHIVCKDKQRAALVSNYQRQVEDLNNPAKILYGLRKVEKSTETIQG
jgi:hypothetical protein